MSETPHRPLRPSQSETRKSWLSNLHLSLRFRRGFPLLLGAFGFLLLGVYQNCSESIPMAKKVSASSELPGLSGPAFPFELKVDHVAYMTCIGLPQNFDRGTFFTFKVGAYNSNSGVTLSSQWVSEANQKRMSEIEAINSLEAEQLSQGATVQFAVRNKANLVYDYVHMTDGNNLTDSVPIVWGPLSNYSLAQSLVRLNVLAGEHLNRWQGVPFEAAVHFNSLSASNEAEVRTHANDRTGYLSLTFSSLKTSLAEAARSPAEFVDTSSDSSLKGVFGSGLGLSFQAPEGSIGSSASRVMSSVSEFNLLSKPAKATGHGWICPTANQFKIVPRALWQAAGCADPASDLSPRSPQAAAALIAAENILGPNGSQWFIDTNNHCVIQNYDQAGTCYPNSGLIQWNQALACGGNTGVQCAHWLSICTGT